MGGTDTFSNTTFDPTTWSQDVTANADGTYTITAAGPGNVTLAGTVSGAGQSVDISQDGTPLGAWDAVVDVSGGMILSGGVDDNGDPIYYAVFSQPFTVGQSYAPVSGFGHFDDTGADQACFVAGTRIGTPSGWTAVEHLRPGDMVATMVGKLPARVAWVGQRRVRCDRHPRPWDVHPIRVAAGALADGVPLRDLYLSPDHALLVDGALVPVRHLLNGATIAQIAQAAVTYHHVELARHDVLDAEGAPAESYLDTGNRDSFAKATATVVALHADFSRHPDIATKPCLPLLTGGPHLVETHARLLRRARSRGHCLGTDPALAITADDRPLVTLANDDAETRVVVPAGTTIVRLGSRVARPAETASGSIDHRPLGLCVTGLSLDGRDLALDDAALSAGWHGAEVGHRWTSGSASLTLPPSRTTRTLVLRTSRHLRYWTAHPAMPRAA